MINKVVLITGVCGGTGSYLARECIRNGETVVGVDNLFKGTVDNVADLLDNDNFVLLIEDLRDIPIKGISSDVMYGNKDIVSKDLNIMIDEIYNMGAVVETRYFYDRPDLTYKVNCQGAIDLFDWAIKNNVRKFVNASSSEIYGHGNGKSEWNEFTNSVYDSVDNTTRWSYAHGKILTEYYMNAFRDKISVCHLRYANCYGPHDTAPEHIIPALINSLLHENTPLEVNRNPNLFHRAFLHMKDAGIATYKAMQNMKTGTAYNIGTHEQVSISELISMIESVMREEGIEPHNENLIYSISRPGDPRYRLLDCNRAYSQLKWSPSISLHDGVREMVKVMSKW